MGCGILRDEHARPGRLSLLLRSPALLATWRAFESHGHLLLLPGWRLGLLTGGKTGKANRAEAWRSYRREDCENEQGRSLDIKQGVGLREIPGIEPRLRTG
jgi:hypothetical protein